MSNENEIEKKEHDEELAMKKALAYGWNGTDAVAIKVDSNGVVQLS